jgi:hypothetical protein
MNSLGLAAGGAGVLVVVLSLWSLDHAQMARDAALTKADELVQDNDALVAHNEVLASALADRAALQEQLTQVSRATQRLNTTLDTQSSLINRNLEELKRNDKAISDYLRQPVPTAIGMRYARPETTDPAAYRAGAASVQPGAVSSPGAPTAGAQ